MKKLTFILISTLLLVAYGCDEGSTKSDALISGELQNPPKNGYVYLEHLTATGISPLDTVKVSESGEFSFDYEIPKKGYYRVKIDQQNFINLILSPGETVSIMGDARNFMDSYQVKGSEASQKLKEYNAMVKENYQKRDSLSKAYRALASDPNARDQMQAVQQEFNTTYKELHDYATGLIEDQPGSFISLAAVRQLSPDTNLKYYLMVDKAFAKKYESSDYYKRFHDEVIKMQKFAVGSEAPEIKLPTPDGDNLALSSLKGKVVLLDFWASWCKPCRKANPEVVRLYNKYKDQGFTVYSVSLDGLPQQQNPKQQWLKAIEQDQLSWDNHVSDLKGWKSPVVNIYNVKGIPMTFLLDEEGKIIGKNLRGQQLANKLKQIFEENQS